MRKNKAILFLIIMLLSACGMRPRGNGKITNYVESYFKGNGKIMFFIKPVDFVSKTKNKLTADFTFIKGDSSTQNVTINYSLFGTPPFTTADSVKITYDGAAYTSTKVTLLYNENVRKHTFSRQGITFPNAYFEALLKSDNVSFTIYSASLSTEYFSTKQWQKTHTKLYQTIFW